VYATVRRVALAMKQAYACNGVSTRQHNEPAGNQDVFHLTSTSFRAGATTSCTSITETWWPPAGEKLPYAERLRAALGV